MHNDSPQATTPHELEMEFGMVSYKYDARQS